MRNYDLYCEQVMSGEQVSCEYVKLAVDRHLRDLEEAGDRGYYFDYEEADIIIEIARLFRHTSGEMAKKNFDLQLWQEFFLAVIFGWRVKKDGTRRFTKVYLEVARKNGKSEFGALLSAICLLADGKYAAEVYSAATKKDQARIVFKAAKSMMKQLKDDNKEDLKGVDIRTSNVNILETESKMEPVASDSDTLDGLKPTCVIIDEYHAHKTSDLLEVMETGMGHCQDPLLLIITTAGFNKEGPCYNLRKVIIEYLKGTKFSDETFGMIFTLDEDSEWEDETKWVKANPNIGKSPNWRYMRSQFIKAKNEGFSKIIQFKTKNLNLWTNASSQWVKDDVWNGNGELFNYLDFAGRQVHLGLDLGTTKDISSLAILIPPSASDIRYHLKVFHFCSEEHAIYRTKQGENYLKWAEEGHLILTPGNVTDYNFIKSTVLKIAESFKIVKLNYDRYNSSQLVIDLQDLGIAVSPFNQGIVNMHAPSSEYERLVELGLMNHGHDPVLKWMMNNVELKFDSSGNFKPDKEKSADKIDGVIASIMALGGYMTPKDGDNLDDSFIASGAFINMEEFKKQAAHDSE